MGEKGGENGEESGEKGEAKEGGKEKGKAGEKGKRGEGVRKVEGENIFKREERKREVQTVPLHLLCTLNCFMRLYRWKSS